MIWQARTTKHVLVETYGMVDTENPTIICACGRSVHADVCVDLTPLPIGVRKALGLHLVDYICDGCQTRLFREMHISEEEFYQLLGAPEEALEIHRARDPLHVAGCELRPEPFRPQHSIVGKAQMIGRKLGEIATTAAIPLKRKRWSHEDAALRVHSDPQNKIFFAVFDPPIELAPDDVPALDEGAPAKNEPEPEVVRAINADDLPADEPLPTGVAL